MEVGDAIGDLLAILLVLLIAYFTLGWIMVNGAQLTQGIQVLMGVVVLAVLLLVCLEIKK